MLSSHPKAKRLTASFAAFAALSLLVAACAPAQPGAPAQPAAPAQVRDFVTWYQFDEKNEDPKSDERVGNEYLRKTIPQFNEAFKDKWRWVNQPQPFDKMDTNLVAAVQAGGEVPDLMQAGDGSLIPLLKNGAIQYLTDWIKAQSWFSDLDPSAVAACTARMARFTACRWRSVRTSSSSGRTTFRTAIRRPQRSSSRPLKR